MAKISPIRLGAALFWFATLQFAAAMLFVQAAYPCHSNVCYNMLTNPISDLGNTSTSPFYYVFNASLALFGLLLLIGILFIKDAFPKGIARTAGFSALVIAAIGSLGVAMVPENTILEIHSISALIAFFFSGLGILLLGYLLYKKFGSKKHIGYTAYTIISGIIPVAVLLLYLLPSGGISSSLALSGPGWGFGGVERVIAFPPLLWIFVTGLYLYRKKF